MENGPMVLKATSIAIERHEHGLTRMTVSKALEK